MDADRMLEALKSEPDVIPDSHDGSYELMRELIASYSTISDYSTIDYKDLNAIYAMAIGTWKLNVERKKEYVNKGHLNSTEKKRMADVIDQVWDKACRYKYENRENNRPSIGMFGTGFYSFERNADDASSQKFVKMMVDIYDMSDDDEMYSRAAIVFDDSFKGMQAAAASVMLHCLKPYSFPILNANYGDGTIYEALGIDLSKPGRLITYVENCRKIKDYRDNNLGLVNYRVFDIFPRQIIGSNAPRYIPSLDEYNPGINSEQYVDLLVNAVNKEWLDTVYYLYLLGGEATFSFVAKNYGKSYQHYNMNSVHTAMAIQNATQCPLCSREQGGDRYWAILYQGRYTENTEDGTFSLKLREPLWTAIDELNRQGYFDFLDVKDGTMKNNKFCKNIILYGPPGTGKTYNTIAYAVAIIEKKPLESIQSEALRDYPAVKARFEKYKSQGRIAFTTFHQSYGYEDFIEGIKPVMDASEYKVEYSIEDGVFKSFCNKASVSADTYNRTDLGLNSNPTIWKVSLARTYDNPIRRDCMENGYIRVGFSQFGENWSDESESVSPPLNAFYNKMEIGDIVLSCYTNETIDAIGVITGDVEYHKEYSDFRRIRKVKWLVKGIKENIVDINGGSRMTLATVYQLKISLSDVLAIVDKYSNNSIKSNYDDNYVFIIDEINRGNISKVFGELITLVEEKKRIGSKEELRVQLPYSHQSFGVPQNVYIIGTMNTADRSIAIMDTALRRRFSFVEMLPDSNVLRNMGISEVKDNDITLNVADMLDVINERITFLYDREHTIGHAYFQELQEDSSIDTLASIFKDKIIPLLQEYFYDDYEKIQLVLGDDGKKDDNSKYKFIADEEVKPNTIFETNPEMESAKKYTIQYSAFSKIESYKKISNRL